MPDVLYKLAWLVFVGLANYRAQTSFFDLGIYCAECDLFFVSFQSIPFSFFLYKKTQILYNPPNTKI